MAMNKSAIRWSDHDSYFGPFTYARERGEYRHIALVLGSGDGDDYPGCRLRLSGFGRTLIIALPAVIKPWRQKVMASSWNEETVNRLGRNWYWDTHEREYGVSYADGFLQVFLGRQTNDSSTQQSWCKHLPWTQWRHVRHSLYDLDGEHYYTVPPHSRLGADNYREVQALVEFCPTADFAFTDFDGEHLMAKTRIEEWEWRFGEGRFKWLSLFRKPMIKRSLYIDFSGETGKRKGSWKGGTMGHSITMNPGELHESAFRRYCAEHQMTFIGDQA